jgi:hypothetical protein
MSDVFFKRMLAMKSPKQGSVWVRLPPAIEDAIRRWQSMFVQAIPIAKINHDLRIAVIAGIPDLNECVDHIAKVASYTTPMRAVAMRFDTKRINELQTALVITVDCPDLQELHRSIAADVTYAIEPLMYAPCIVVATFENITIDDHVLNDLKASGIIGVDWIINELKVGTSLEERDCPFYGHAPMRFGATTPDTSLFGKANGMSTLDMESGGALIDTEYSIDIDDDDDDDDDDEDDEDDDAWMSRALGLSDTLDGGY